MISHEPRPRAADAVNDWVRPLALSLIALALGVGACGRVPGQFEIVQNQVPTPGCLITTSETLYRGDGTLDLALVQPGSLAAYIIFPLLRNNLPGSTGGPDPNQIEVNSFAVDIGESKFGSLPAGVKALFQTLEQNGPGSPEYALLHYSAPWQLSLASGGGTAASHVAGFPIDLAARVAATGAVGVSRTSMLVNIKVRAFGKTNTQSMESDPLDYPVYVCNGCLVANVLTCPYPSAPANEGNPCNVSQDNFVDCCSLNGQLICPPIVSTAQ
jgi:hypothetical protein